MGELSEWKWNSRNFFLFLKSVTKSGLYFEISNSAIILNDSNKEKNYKLKAN